MSQAARALASTSGSKSGQPPTGGIGAVQVQIVTRIDVNTALFQSFSEGALPKCYQLTSYYYSVTRSCRLVVLRQDQLMDARKLTKLRTDLTAFLDEVAGSLGHPRRRHWCDAYHRGVLL